MIGSIYSIYWWDLDIVYIGQTSRILEHRIKQHEYSLSKGTHYNKKIQEAYNISKNYIFTLLETCSLAELDDKEMSWILEFNAINPINGANKTYGGSSAGKGLNHARSKYSKRTVLKVFSLLLRNINVKDIALRVPLATQHLIYDIRSGTGHRWLKEEYPDKYLILENIKNQSTRSHKTIYPTFKDSNGNVYNNVINIAKFCRDTEGLVEGDCSDLRKMLKGTRLSCKGFSLA